MTRMVRVPGVLSADQVAGMRARLDAAEWIDGNATSGAQAAQAKRNLQLAETSPLAAALGGEVLDALGRSALFIAAALPLKVYPPLFNRYEGGHGFGFHVDNAIRHRLGGDFRLRSDLSATLFLSDPADYEGGELIAGEGAGAAPVKLAAGDLILYPATTLHRVTAVTRGTRVASFFWVQSMVREDAARETLLDLDGTIQALTAERGHSDGAVIRLTGIYHNLLRRWADA